MISVAAGFAESKESIAGLNSSVHRLGSAGNEAREPAWGKTFEYLWEKGKFGEQLSLVENWLCDNGDDIRDEGGWVESACRLWWRRAHGCPNGFGQACSHGAVLKGQ